MNHYKIEILLRQLISGITSYQSVKRQLNKQEWDMFNMMYSLIFNLHDSNSVWIYQEVLDELNTILALEKAERESL
jgi:hypothetical protein